MSKTVKICVVCGDDCSARSRAKDPLNRYYCWDCYEHLLSLNGQGSQPRHTPIGIPAMGNAPAAPSVHGTVSPLVSENPAALRSSMLDHRSADNSLALSNVSAAGILSPSGTEGPIEPLPNEEELPVSLEGPAWERRATVGMPRAFARTFKELLLHPALTFSELSQDRELGSPVTFSLVSSSLSLFCAATLSHIFAAWANNSPPTVLDRERLIIFLICLAVLPALFLLRRFFFASAFHASFQFLVGERLSYRTTFRVLSYTGGFISITGFLPVAGAYLLAQQADGWILTPFLQWIPTAGATIVIFWYAMLLTIGFANGHQISLRRSTVAFALPFLVVASAALLIWQMAAGT